MINQNRCNFTKQLTINQSEKRQALIKIVKLQNFFWKFGDQVRVKRNEGAQLPGKNDQSPSRAGKGKQASQQHSPMKTRPTSPHKKEQSASPSARKKEKSLPQSTMDRMKQEELTQCTFKPHLIANNQRYWNPGDQDFLKRCELWLEQKQNKLIKQRQVEIQNTLKGCTFQPKISDNSKNIVFAIGQEEDEQYLRMSHQKKTHSYAHTQQLESSLGERKQKQQQQLFGVINQYQVKDKQRYEEAVAQLHAELHKLEINLEQ